MTVQTRGLLAGATLSLVVGAGSLAPAYAGGDGQVYVYGNTLSQCRTNLDAAVAQAQQDGFTVTGVNGCRRTGDGKRYFADFVEH